MVDVEELVRVVRVMINNGEIESAVPLGSDVRGGGSVGREGSAANVWDMLAVVERKICERFGCSSPDDAHGGSGWAELGLGPSFVATLSSEPSLRAALGPVLGVSQGLLGGGGGPQGIGIDAALEVMHSVTKAKGLTPGE